MGCVCGAGAGDGDNESLGVGEAGGVLLEEGAETAADEIAIVGFFGGALAGDEGHA